MDFATLTPVEGFSVPFFDDIPTVPPMPKKDYYKIYHDGGHYVAIERKYIEHKTDKCRKRKKEDIDILLIACTSRRGKRAYGIKSMA